MKLEVGNIITFPAEGPKVYAVVERRYYTASAHNDRWDDYQTTLLELKSNLTPHVNQRTSIVTTDDVFSRRVPQLVSATAKVEIIKRYEVKVK